MKIQETENSRYSTCCWYTSTHTITHTCTSGKRKTHITFNGLGINAHSYTYMQIRGTENLHYFQYLLVFINAHNNTHMKIREMENSHYFQYCWYVHQHTQLHITSGKQKTHINFNIVGIHQSTQLHKNVDPGKQKTHITFNVLVIHQPTQLHIHVDPGNGKLTLLSTLLVHYNTFDNKICRSS